MSDYGSPMWWTQMFAVWSNVIVFGGLFLALFSPGWYDIVDWFKALNLRFDRKKSGGHRAKKGKVQA